MKSARQIVWESLQIWEKSQRFADTIVENQIRKRLSELDADLGVEIFYGVIRWQARLNYIIDQSNFKIKDLWVRLLLQIGLYQILFLDRVPDYAAVNETVSLAPQKLRNLVNAFFRTFLRNRESWDAKLAHCREKHPDVFYSHPGWLIQKWVKRFGKLRSRQLLEWNNTIPAVFIRTNTLKTTPQQLSNELKKYLPRPTAHPLVFEIESPAGLFGDETFKKGHFYAQDLSTLKAVELLDPRPGEKVLDVCSAPGGKTTYIAQLMKNQGEVTASDLDGRRLRLLEENKKRLGCSSIAVVPLNTLSKSSKRFDRILLDVPCSNTGVLRRRIDLRWNITLKEIARLAMAQFDLCKEYIKFLKPAGVLVYSTCSLEPEENEDVVEKLLNSFPQLKIGETWKSFPPDSKMDGAFAAKLINAPLAGKIPTLTPKKRYR